MFDVLAEPNRRHILDLLLLKERSVGELVEQSHLSQPGVSKHLRILREAGLVQVQRRGQTHIYRLCPEPLAEMDNWLLPYRKFWSKKPDNPETWLHEEE
ncbi:ArsR/SmtB family transcription factor [Brevibacillus sp. TJ4]|uniref:ArsR/SmtB family transcription factor n=1 Tax=Brevibacillus sp. TJ4 TaxID=3234853 RepID=UPI0037CCCEC4